MARFRLFHASDLYIAAKPKRVGLFDVRKPRYLPDIAFTSSYSPELLARLIDFVHYQGEDDRFDVVLVSGDLATTGKKEDLKKAYYWIIGGQDGLYVPPFFGRPEFVSSLTLKETARDIVLLPGNHDRYQSVPLTPFFLPGGTFFNNCFGHYWDSNPSVKVKGWVSPPKGGTRLGLIRADLTLRKMDYGTGIFGSYGQGRAYAEVIVELKMLTDKLRAENPGIGLLWVVHFPPKYPANKDFLRLLEDDALIKAANEKRISHLLCGHTHIPQDYIATSSDGSTVEVLCAGTATQYFAPDGNFIHELTIEVGEEGSTSVSSFQSFRWNDADLDWVPAACPVKKTKK